MENQELKHIIKTIENLMIEDNKMKIAEYIIPGPPVSMARPRFWNGRAVTAKKSRDYKRLAEKLIKLQLKNAGNIKAEEDHVLHVDIQYFFPRPKSLKRKKDSQEYIPHFKKPDLDNLIKMTNDILSDLAFHDDRQIFKITSQKFYTTYDYQTKKEGFIGSIIKIWVLEC